MRALDLVDNLKSEVPVLGPRQPLDYGAAEKVRLPDGLATVEEITAALVRYFEGLTIWGIRVRRSSRAAADGGQIVEPEAVTALKSFILSPFTDEANVEEVVEKVLAARTKVAV